MSFNELIRLGASNPSGYEIEKSLRFNSGDSAKLERIPSSTGNQKVWTWSGWVKRTKLGHTDHIFGCDNDADGNNNGIAGLYFNSSDDKLHTYFDTSGTAPYGAINDRVYRDVSAWLHIVWKVDAANTETKIWVNGVEETIAGGNMPPDYSYHMNQASFRMNMGVDGWDNSTYSNLYFAEVHYCDGQEYQASDFGETDIDTGQWIPKEVTGITYGTNGFYLPLTGESLNTSFVDSSSYARTVTRVGDVIHSTTQKKVGASSINRPSTPNSCIHVPDSSDFDWGTNDWTLECWIRRDAQGGDEWLMAHTDGTGANTSIGLHIWSSSVANSNKPSIRMRQSSSNIDCNGTTELAADTWYHIAGVRDGNTLRIYVNGVQEGTTSISGSPDTSSASFAFTALRSNGDSGLTGYMDEIRVSKSCRYTSGTSFTPSTTAFSSDANTLVLIHSNITGTDIAADASGTGNNWTASNFSIADGVTNDSLTDTPTNNWCTWNPLVKSGNAFSEGNLKVTCSSSTPAKIVGTIGVTSGKWYFEEKLTTVTNVTVGVTSNTKSTNYLGIGDSIAFWPSAASGFTVFRNASNINSDVSGGSGTGTNWAINDIMGIALDMDAKNVHCYKNGTLAGTVSFSSFGTAWDEVYFGGGNYIASQVYNTNFGQRAFSHLPAGYKALNTANLPTPTIKDGTKNFNTVLYTGNSSTNAITGVGFAPNFVWVKNRVDTDWHALFDTVRGVGKPLYINDSSTEDSVATSLTAFDSDGFTLGAHGNANQNTEAYVSWNWKESASAGYDIVSYTGNGQDDTDIAISHSLGVSPELVLVRNRSTAKRWQAWHKNLDSGKNAIFSDSVAQNTYSSYIKAVSSSNFTVRDNDADGNGNVNKNGDNYIAYLFTSVAGFCRVGSYTGNGNADGTFIYTGFRVAYLLVKNSDRGANWTVYDTKRRTANANATILEANITNAEETGHAFDFLSNGFKVRNTNSSFNHNGEEMIYLAYAERPFKYANAR